MAMTVPRPVQELKANGIHIFCGITFAAAPVGALRWHARQSTKKRTTVGQAITAGSSYI